MAKATIIFSHWSTMIEGLNASPKEFFAAVEAAVKDKQLDKAKHSRINWKEGGMLSAKREYLRIKRQEYAFDVCGAPFGNGFFVSWWLGEVPSGFLGLLIDVPVLGPLIERFVKPQTYYKIDTANMFQSLVHGAVLQVIDDMTETQGVRALPQTERKPEMKSFFSD
ncbi:MAG: hypothetical protein AAF578_13965 [Pseudomonadota bacterium]